MEKHSPMRCSRPARIAFWRARQTLARRTIQNWIGLDYLIENGAMNPALLSSSIHAPQLRRQQAMIKFPHAEWDRRLRTLEESVTDLQACVERLESSTD